MKSTDKKCIWSGEKSPDVKPVSPEYSDQHSFLVNKELYVLQEYEADLRQFTLKFNQHKKVFFISLLSLPFMLVILLLAYFTFPLSQQFLLISLGLLVAVVGILFITFPFATPETMQWLGIRKSIRITRMFGAAIVIIGILVALS